MRSATVLAAVVLAAVTLAPWAAEAVPEGGEAAVAISATLEVERALLEEDLARHLRLAQRRTLALQRLEELHRALDAAIQRKDGGGLEGVDALMAQVEEAERERSQQLVAERVVVERVQERLLRIHLLEERLEGLRSRAEQRRGPLEGRWTVSLLPTNQRGTFELRQSGAVITGTYELEGGWTGSLEGTLVERKVHLVRIDSKLGRAMEFEGFLSPDGLRIRGTWQSYEMSGGAAPGGHWSAMRGSGSP